MVCLVTDYNHLLQKEMTKWHNKQNLMVINSAVINRNCISNLKKQEKTFIQINEGFTCK